MDWRRLRLWHATLGPTNNRNHYYLSDAMGGNIGQYVDDDGDPDTDRVAVFQQFDAFGNDMTKPLSSTSSFAWRGQEGSVTDRASGLVYMQSRHYDPSIGRFIQADILPIASLTTQGMNRYIYCENDPVNKSDPTGYWVFALIGALSFGIGFWAGLEIANVVAGGDPGLLLRAISAVLAILTSFYAARCWMTVEAQLERLLAWFLSGAITAQLFTAAFSNTLFGFMGILFGAGVIAGFAIGSMFASSAGHEEEDLTGEEIGRARRYAVASLGATPVPRSAALEYVGQDRQHDGEHTSRSLLMLL